MTKRDTPDACHTCGRLECPGAPPFKGICPSNPRLECRLCEKAPATICVACGDRSGSAQATREACIKWVSDNCGTMNGARMAREIKAPCASDEDPAEHLGPGGRVLYEATDKASDPICGEVCPGTAGGHVCELPPGHAGDHSDLEPSGIGWTWPRCPSEVQSEARCWTVRNDGKRCLRPKGHDAVLGCDFGPFVQGRGPGEAPPSVDWEAKFKALSSAAFSLAGWHHPECADCSGKWSRAEGSVIHEQDCGYTEDQVAVYTALDRLDCVRIVKRRRERDQTRDHAAGLSSISEAAFGASESPPPAGASRQAGTTPSADNASVATYRCHCGQTVGKTEPHPSCWCEQCGGKVTWEKSVTHAPEVGKAWCSIRCFDKWRGDEPATDSSCDPPMVHVLEPLWDAVDRIVKTADDWTKWIESKGGQPSSGLGAEVMRAVLEWRAVTTPKGSDPHGR